MDAKRILKEIDVQFISLVGKGANGKQIIFKSKDQAAPNFTKEIKLIKTDDEKHLVYGTVYEPDSVDSQGDKVESAAVIEKSAHLFLSKLNNKNVDTQHDFNPDEGVVVESYILRSADPMFPDTKVGSWVVAIKIASDATWALIKSGEIGGLSLAGLAVVEEIAKSDGMVSEIVKAIKAGFEKLNPLKKDYNEELSSVEIRTKVYALTDAIYAILNDDTITDKKATILASIDQFKADVGTDVVTKSGKKISQANLDKIKAAHKNLADVITAATAETTNDGEKDMEKADIQKIVTDSITAAMKSVTDEVAKVTGEITAIKADIKKASDRVEEVAKMSPGSKQVEGDPVQVKKSKTNWLGA